MTLEEVSLWTDQLAVRLPLAPSRCLVDLGAGTGRFSPSLAERCDARVIGIEPSASMRAVAAKQNRHRRVEYVGGAAEGIPIRDGVADGAFLFLSLHHFSDRRRAATELVRVCKPGAIVVIRTEFLDRPHLTYWHGLLPGAANIDRNLYPPFDDCVADLRAGGLLVLAVHHVPYKAAKSLRDYLDRLQSGTLSAVRLYGTERVQAHLAGLVFSDAQLSHAVFEVGHLMVCEVPRQAAAASRA